ncbi:MAG TPA: nucleotidyltransferase family protein [Candidatus Thermoplasmatota archaeon]|nr:nucleotidyltransferase family protein [Candidatus Thermoplasmatota archaeon]
MRLPDPRLGVVVPAAGAGRRLGTPKALARLGGETFVARVVREAARVAGDIVVVLGPRAEEARPLVPSPARVVVHEGWERGRTGSIKAGLAALGDVDAFLVWPVDVPLARAEDAIALLRAAPRGPAVPVVDGRRGHPVLLPASLRADVLALADDEPLHGIVRAAAPREVTVDNAGVLFDVNTPEDLRRAEAFAAAFPGAVE